MRTHVDHISQAMSHVKHIGHFAAHISHVDSHPDTRSISSCVIMEKCRPEGVHNFHWANYTTREGSMQVVEIQPQAKDG